ncbi:MAG TPA: fatty acid desaturase [Stellaceae bacterium]|nr:fatty acid desaturase [Stellaceae bacterium]
MEDWVAKRAATLIEPRRLKQLSARSDRHALTQLATQLAALGLTSAALASGIWWLAVPGFMAQGILLNCLYAGQHEMSHWTAFRSRRLNDWVGEAIGFLMIYPARWDRWFHFAHHRHTQDWDKDPELLVRGPYSFASWLFNMSAALYWYGRGRSTLRLASGIVPAYVWWLNDKQRGQVIGEARWHVAGYAAILALSMMAASWVAVEFWLAPMLLMKWFHQLQNVGEHTCLTHEPDTLRNTRTLRGPAVMRWLVWNMSFHAAHHSFPGVPFHALPELHEEIARQVGPEMPGGGYLAVQVEIGRALSAAGERLEPVT